MIQKVINKLKKVFIPESEFVNDEPKKIEKSQSSYTGVPAPVISPSDSWFSEPVVTEKGQDYMVQETEFKVQEQEKIEQRKLSGEVVEPDNIHEVMYQMATKSG